MARLSKEEKARIKAQAKTEQQKKEEAKREKDITAEKEKQLKIEKQKLEYQKSGLSLQGVTFKQFQKQQKEEEAHWKEREKQANKDRADRKKSQLASEKESKLYSINVELLDQIADAQSAGDTAKEKHLQGMLSINQKVDEQIKNIGTDKFVEVDLTDNLKSLANEILAIEEEIVYQRALGNDDLAEQLEKKKQMKQDEQTNMGLAQQQAQINNKQNTMLNIGLDHIQGAKDKMTAWTEKAEELSNLVKSGINPAFLAASAILAVGLKTFGEILSNAKSIREETGQTLTNSLAMAATAKDIETQYGMFGVDATEAQAAVEATADAMGGVSRESLKAAHSVAQLTAQFGIVASDSAKIMVQMKALGGVSGEAAENMMEMASAMAQGAGVSPADVMSDVAQNSELFAKFGKQGGKNMMKAAIATRKLGMELETISTITDSIMNIEESITAEMEASVMLGRQINFNKARELMMAGDMVGAQKEILKQVGSQAEFDKMSFYQREALAGAMGIQVDQLGTMISNQEELNNLTWAEKQTADMWASSVEYLAKAWKVLSRIMMALLVPAVVFFLPSIILGLKTAAVGLWSLVAPLVMSAISFNIGAIAAAAFWIAATAGLILVVAGIISLIAYFGEITDWLKEHKDLIFTFLFWPFMLAWKMIKGVFDLIKGAWSAVGDNIKSIGSAMLNTILSPFTTAWDAVKALWNGDIGITEALTTLATSWFQILTTPFRLAWTYITGLFDFDALFSGLKSGLSSIASFFGFGDSKKVDDVAMGPGPKTVTSSAGSYSLNPNDSLVAGTNLGGGGGGANLAPLMEKLDKLIEVASQGGTINLDGKKVGNVLAGRISHPVRG
tara:strand:- start:1030 stop:3570 length:2541 start_codon:yes stop_codon:yes gene_type:complete